MAAQQATPFTDAHAAWHAGVESARVAPYGPLSPTALHWLGRDPARLPDLPGVWRTDGSGLVTVELSPEDGVTRDGSAVSGTVPLGPLHGLETTTLDWGEIRIEVASRSGGIAVRPRDPHSRDRAEYSGTA